MSWEKQGFRPHTAALLLSKGAERHSRQASGASCVRVASCWLPEGSQLPKSENAGGNQPWESREAHSEHSGGLHRALLRHMVVRDQSVQVQPPERRDRARADGALGAGSEVICGLSEVVLSISNRKSGGGAMPFFHAHGVNGPHGLRVSPLGKATAWVSRAMTTLPAAS